MIAYLSGTLHAKNLRDVIVLVAGVGYKVFLPLAEFAKIGSIGESIAVHVHTYVREDAIDLYGFLDVNSLRLFEQLIQVSGIGPKLALAMLSALDPKVLVASIHTGDQQTLTRIPGVGAKTAQRIILELKDRLGQFTHTMTRPTFGMLDDLRSAMGNLGYKAQLIDKAIESVEPLAKEGYSLDRLIKEALKRVNQSKESQ